MEPGPPAQVTQSAGLDRVNNQSNQLYYATQTASQKHVTQSAGLAEFSNLQSRLPNVTQTASLALRLYQPDRLASEARPATLKLEVFMPRGLNVLEYKKFYRRFLPHWQPEGATIFLTYRLVDSLPKHVWERINSDYQRWRQEASAAGTPTSQTLWQLNKRKIIAIDEALDFEKSGSHWLADRRIADLIVGNLLHHAESLYHLWAYAVMSNHVHAQLEPLAVTQSAGLEASPSGRLRYVSLARITHALKSYTSKQANKILERSGSFWQIESYDHWIRNENEFRRVVAYIENNPVKVGLCKRPQDWQWSSAHKRKELGLDYADPLPPL